MPVYNARVARAHEDYLGRTAPFQSVTLRSGAGFFGAKFSAFHEFHSNLQTLVFTCPRVGSTSE